MSATNVTSFAASLADLGLSGDANPLAPLFSQLRNLNASLFMTVAGVALFMYDWLIMFDDEWQHIWYGGRINSVKLLYILNRILTPAILAVDLYDKGGLAKNMTQETCRWALNFDGWGTIISYGSIHWIVTLRVWTVYGRSRRLLAVFGVTFLAYFVATSYIWARGSAEISKTIFPSPVVVRICYTVIPEWLWWLWVPNIVYECIIFFATLWKAWEHHNANLNTPILAVLYRDGFIYFFVICLLSLANMFTWLWAPHSLAILFKYFSLAAVNVAASRLVLDLRTVGQANRTTLNAGTAASRPTVAKRASHPLHVSLDRQVLQDVEMSPRYQGYADLSNGPGQLYRNPSSHGHGQHGTAVPEGRSVFVEDDPEMLEGWEVVQRQEATHARSPSSATATAFSPKSRHGHTHSPSTHSHRAYGQVPMSAGGASNPRSPFSPQETDRFYTPTSPTSASIGMRALSPASPRSPTGGSRIPPELIAAIDFGPPDEPTPKAQKRFSQRKPAPPALGLGLEPPPRRNPGRHPYAPQSDSPSASDYSPSMASFSNSVHSANPPHALAGSFVPRMSISGSLRSYDPEAADAIERDAALDRDGRHGSFQGPTLRPYRESAGSVSVYSQQDGAPNPYRASNVSHATTFGRSHQTHGTQAGWSEEGNGGAGAQYGRQQR